MDAFYYGRAVVFATVASSSLFATAIGAPESDSMPVRSGVIRIELESSKPSYQAGEPILIRVLMTNLTSEAYNAIWSAPWELCTLIVLNSARQPVPSTHYPWGTRRSMADVYQFPPHATVPARYGSWYAGLPDSHRAFEWTDIGKWGYHLSEPGTYTLIALPTISSLRATVGNARAFATSISDASTPIQIRVDEPPAH
jgi:hypothetical protein